MVPVNSQPVLDSCNDILYLSLVPVASVSLGSIITYISYEVESPSEAESITHLTVLLPIC